MHGVLCRIQVRRGLPQLRNWSARDVRQNESVFRLITTHNRQRLRSEQSVDVVAGLDHRDDLMTQAPTEFEHLVRQLFEATPAMGGWTAQTSEDDGIDAVILNAPRSQAA